MKKLHSLKNNQWVAGVQTVWTHFLALLRFCQHSHTFNITDVRAHQKTQKVHFTAKENNSTEHYGTHYESDTNLKWDCNLEIKYINLHCAWKKNSVGA